MMFKNFFDKIAICLLVVLCVFTCGAFSKTLLEEAHEATEALNLSMPHQNKKQDKNEKTADSSNDENEDDDEDNEEEEEDVCDPFEPYNRLMFKINNALDKAFIKPLAIAYNRALPKALKFGISNFTNNFFAPAKLFNFLLQGNGEQATKTVFRFLINSTFGFFGTIDVAGKIGIKNQNTSFGDTLKKWGAKPGPYFVFPILGSTSLRGAVGTTVHFPLESWSTKIILKKCSKKTRNISLYSAKGLELLGKRAGIVGLLDSLEKTSNDHYVTIRKVIMSLES